MNAQKVSVKLYATQAVDASLDSYIPAFHRFIQQGSLDELMIDVADYTHVPKGTGVLLVGHAFDLALDQGEGRPGLVYFRKRSLPEGASLVSDALGRVLQAAKKLDADSEVRGPKGFSGGEVLFRFADRLHVQNDAAGFAAVSGAVLEALAAHLPGKAFQLSQEGDPREPLTVRARAKS